MIVIPVDIGGLLQCAAAALLFETLRILIAYLIARPSPQMAKLDIDKREAQVEVAKIKSVQLEFVKHSLLQRKVISIEKKMELLQLQYNPRLQAVRKVFRVLRIVVYIAVGVLLSSRTLILVNPMVLWPLSWFTSAETVSLPAWFLMFALGGTVRHVLRTVLPLVFSSTSFP
ncbi:hypothetical protein B484DRAFT_419944 [Ochromonadaceae sp. CCMP2298]|nr:hypothetical protein B484DRAFT_419944 [Ochromonadaceae sp. CCMP2298]